MNMHLHITRTLHRESQTMYQHTHTPPRGFEPRPTAWQADTVTTTPPHHTIWVDFRGFIYALHVILDDFTIGYNAIILHIWEASFAYNARVYVCTTLSEPSRAVTVSLCVELCFSSDGLRIPHGDRGEQWTMRFRVHFHLPASYSSRTCPDVQPAAKEKFSAMFDAVQAVEVSWSHLYLAKYSLPRPSRASRWCRCVYTDSIM